MGIIMKTILFLPFPPPHQKDSMAAPDTHRGKIREIFVMKKKVERRKDVVPQIE